MADRVDQRHGRDHGGGPVGGQQSLCEEPRGGIRGRGRDRQPGILGGGEPHLPEGDRADPAELHRDAAGRHPAQPGRDGKDLYDVHDPALPECGHPDRRGGRLESAGGAVQGGRQRREQGRAAAGDKAAGPGHSEPGGAGGGVCRDEDRRGLPAAPVGPGAGRERRRDPEEHGEPLFLAVHREHDGKLFVGQRAVQPDRQCHPGQGLRRDQCHEHQRGKRHGVGCGEVYGGAEEGHQRDGRGGAGKAPQEADGEGHGPDRKRL